MKKIPMVIVAVVVCVSVMLGIVMFMVGTEGDVDTILSSFKSTSNNIRRPISVAEIKLQTNKSENADDTSGGNNPALPGGGTGGGTGGGVSGSWSEQLIKMYNDTSRPDRTHYQDGVYFAIRNIKGKEYIWECQSKGAYPDKIQPNGSKIDKEGCYYFALVAYASNKSGRVITVADILRNVGCNVSFANGKYVYDTNSKYSLSGANTVDAIFTDMGLPYSRGADTSDWNKIESELDKGNWILYYTNESSVAGSNRKLSSSTGKGYHWTIIVDYDDDYYYFLCNGGRNPAQPKDWVKQHRNYAFPLY